MIVADVFNTTHRRAIISLAERHRVPAVYFSRYFATEGGLKVDYRSVWEFVHAEKLSFKKSVVAGERDRPNIAWRRAQWTKYQDRIAPERLVFIDETWTKTNMAPLRGWAPCGQRLIAKVPHGRWKTTTFVAALRFDRRASGKRTEPVHA
jgi:hypothetical protein